MPSIRIDRFGGLRGAISERALAASSAQVAHNAKLTDGSLRALRAPLKVKDADFEPGTVWESPDTSACCGQVYCWEGCVHPVLLSGCGEFSHAAVFGVRGDGGVYAEPEQFDLCGDETCPLCVPRPPDALVVDRVNIGSGPAFESPDERAYTYTWVDKFGRESAPACATSAGTSWDNGAWAISGFSPPPAHVCEVRLYRTGATPSTGDVAAPTFQLVASLDPGTTSILDDAPLKDIAFSTLLTGDVCCPPYGMTDVHELDSGYMVGFVRNDVYFSERHEPHNWPDRHRFTLPDRIVGVAVYGDEVFVGTTGHPYRMVLGEALDPVTQRPQLDVTVQPYAMSAPLVNPRALVATQDGAFLASENGLFSLRGPRITEIGRLRIDDCDWSAWTPSSLEWCEGKLYASCYPNARGWSLDVRSGGSEPEFGDLVTLDYAPAAQHKGASGRLLHSGGDGVYAWECGPDLLTYRWRSKKFVSQGHLSMEAALVEGDFGPPVQFRLYQDGVPVAEQMVATSEPFLLPLCGRGKCFEIELEGTTRIHEVHIATSIVELTEARDGG